MTDPVVALVVAVAENGVIGRAGQLPWRIPSDLKTFKRLTLGKPVIMGRKTFRSIGRALPGRPNIVVTRDTAFTAADVIAAPSLAAALDTARSLARSAGTGEVMVIGGAEIYRLAMSSAERIYMTRVHAQPEGDTRFDDPDPSFWRVVAHEPLARVPGDDHSCTLVTYERAAR